MGKLWARPHEVSQKPRTSLATTTNSGGRGAGPGTDEEAKTGGYAGLELCCPDKQEETKWEQ